MRAFWGVLVGFALTASAVAQHQTFAVNTGASKVQMTLNTTHEVVHGTFPVQSGTIGFDRSSPAMTGSVVVGANGETGNGSRDKKMHNDILKTPQFATILFEPKSYSGTIAPSGDSNLQVSGVFTLLGTPHTITVPMLVHIEGTGVTAKAHFAIPYVQWGLKNPSFLIWKCDNDVMIDLDLVGQLHP